MLHLLGYKGIDAISSIDGSYFRYFSIRSRKIRMSFAFLVTLSLAVLVLGSVAAIYIMKSIISSAVGPNYAQYIASIVNGVVIESLNFFYSLLAKKLTKWENHR